MATYTTNYNLKKPAADDFYNIADFNGNADLIDAALKTLTDRVATGSYVGTGTSGSSNPTTITCSFPIKMLYIINSSADRNITMFPWVADAPYVFTVDVTANSGYGLYECPVTVTNDGRTVAFYYSGAVSGIAMRQMNYSGDTYKWFAIG